MDDYCYSCHQEKFTAGIRICSECMADKLVKVIKKKEQPHDNH